LSAACVSDGDKETDARSADDAMTVNNFFIDSAPFILSLFIQ
jgi:hypothetical protein